MVKLLKKLFVLLLVVVALVVGLYYFELWRFNKELKTNFIKQELSFPYYLKAGGGTYTAYIGDLNGLNRQAYLKLNSIVAEDGVDQGAVVIPSIFPEKSKLDLKTIRPEDFLVSVSNNNGVVIVDNFCTTKWKELKGKSLYEESALTPGPICNSEEETGDLVNILKKFNIKKVKLFHDTEGYKEFIRNFLDYLRENRIEYEFIEV